MSDLTKCSDHNCPSRETCWRFVAPAKFDQSFANFGRRGRETRCLDYWPVTAKDKRVRRVAIGKELSK